MANDSDQVHIDYMSEKGILNLEVNNKKISLGLVSLDSIQDQSSVPEYDYGAKFTTTKEMIEDAINTADIFGNKVTFQIENDREVINISSKLDIDQSLIELTKSDVHNIETVDLQNSYDLRYLTDILGSIPDGSIIKFKLTSGGPMKLKYAMFEGTGTVEFTVAPWTGD